MSSSLMEPASENSGTPAGPRHGFRAVVQSIGSKSLILGLQAATGVLTARALGPAGRGELAAMILWPLFVASVTTLGVPTLSSTSFAIDVMNGNTLLQADSQWRPC